MGILLSVWQWFTDLFTPPPTVEQAVDYWLRCIKAWYPERGTKTYFLPPQFFRRQQFYVETIGNQPVLVPEPPSKKAKVDMYPPGPSQPQLAQPQPAQPEPGQVAGTVWTLPQGQPAPLKQFQQTDVIDDGAAERLLTCLRVIGDKNKNKEGMVVISQLEFRKYLDNETDPLGMLTNAAACDSLPRADTLDPQHRDGDFDVLVVHSEYGLLVMEVKAVGWEKDITQQAGRHFRRGILRRVDKAISQLKKYQAALTWFTPDINVIKVLVLPYVTEDQLKQTLSANKAVEKELCDQLGSDDLSVALSRCLLADRMPTMKQLGLLAVDTADPASKAEAMRMVDSLLDWWRDVTVCSNGPRPHLSEADYDQLLAMYMCTSF